MAGEGGLAGAMGEFLAGVFGSGFVVFVSEDVRVRKLNLPDAMDELRLSDVGGAGKGCAAIKSRAESLRGFWLVLRLRISSSYSAMRSAVKKDMVSQSEGGGGGTQGEMYICRCSVRNRTGRDNSQTHQLRRLCLSDLRLGLQVSRRGSRFLPKVHISLAHMTRTVEKVSCLMLGFVLLLLFVSQVRVRAAETLVLHS